MMGGLLLILELRPLTLLAVLHRATFALLALSSVELSRHSSRDGFLPHGRVA